MKQKFKTIATQFGFMASVFLLFSACGDQHTFPDIVRAPLSDHGQVRFYNFVINGPTVNFYANGVKSTGITSTTGQEAANGVGWGGTHPNIGYVEIPAGSNVNIESITPKNMLIPASNPNNYEPGIVSSSLIIPEIEPLKQYSVYLSGYWDKVNKKSKSFYIKDEMPGVDTASTFIRFVNSGVEAAGNLKFVVTNRDTLIGTIMIDDKVPYGGASKFIAVPYGTYNVKIYTISGDSLIRNGLALSPDRVHTFALRGDILSKKAPLPYIDNVQNR